MGNAELTKSKYHPVENQLAVQRKKWEQALTKAGLPEDLVRQEQDKQSKDLGPFKSGGYEDF